MNTSSITKNVRSDLSEIRDAYLKCFNENHFIVKGRSYYRYDACEYYAEKSRDAAMDFLRKACDVFEKNDDSGRKWWVSLSKDSISRIYFLMVAREYEAGNSNLKNPYMSLAKIFYPMKNKSDPSDFLNTIDRHDPKKRPRIVVQMDFIIEDLPA